MRRSLVATLFASILFGPAIGQSVELSSGTLTVHPGTTVRLEGPLEWTIASSATVVNNGTIELGTEARLNEAEGAPIIGSGTEHATLVATAPYSLLEPGGLGLSISTEDGPGTVDVTRGHTPQVLHTGDLGIARWYLLSALGQTGEDLDLELRYDPTELNGLDGSDLLLFEALSDEGPWGALPSTADVDARTVSSTDQYPWAYITAYDGNVVATVSEMNEEPSFVIHPVLVEGVLNVSSSGMERITSLEVIDGLGRSVRGTMSPSVGTRATIDLSALVPGPYFLRINGRHVLRFQKA